MTANRYFRPDDPAVRTPLEVPEGACADPYQLAWIAQWLGAPDIVDVGGGAAAVHGLARLKGGRTVRESGAPGYRILLIDRAGPDDVGEVLADAAARVLFGGLLLMTSSRVPLEEAIRVASGLGLRPQGGVDCTEGAFASWCCAFVQERQHPKSRPSSSPPIASPPSLQSAAGKAERDGLPEGPFQSARVEWPSGQRPRILLCADVRGWAFDRNLRDLATTLADRFNFDFWYVADRDPLPILDPYAGVFVPYHRWPCVSRIPAYKALGSLRGRWFRPEEPAPAGPREVELVSRFAGFHVVTRDCERELLAAGCASPPLVYLTNPVNMGWIREATTVKGVVASWNGNARHTNPSGEDVKGFESIVVPACQAAEVELRFAEYNTRRVPPEGMPDFYREGSVSICASLYEGASNSSMEAMAAGQVLVSTDCGNVREMQESQKAQWGDTGILLVERSVEAFADALNELKGLPQWRLRLMGAMNREEIASRWSWAAWADRYADFLMLAVGGA